MAVMFIGNVTPFSTLDWNWGTPPTVSGSLFASNSTQLDFAYSNGDLALEVGGFTTVGGTIFGTVTGGELIDPKGNMIVAVTSANLTAANVLSSTPNQFDAITLAGDDLIVGGAASETIFGFTGNDTIFGGSGNNVIFLGTGADWAVGGSGKTIVTLQAHAGSDVIFVGSGATSIGAAAESAGLSLDFILFFNPAKDSLLFLHGANGINTAQDALAHLFSDGHGNTLLLAGAELALIGNVQPSQITAANIVLV